MSEQRQEGEEREALDRELAALRGLGRNEQVLAAIIATAESRRAHADQLMWQIPALSLTAQAFISSVIFNPNTSPGGRMGAALTALVFAVAAFQSLLKHRHDEGVWSRWLKVFEDTADLPHLNDPGMRLGVSAGDDGSSPASPAWLYRPPAYLLKVKFGRFDPFQNSAFRFWAISLGAVCVIDLCLLALSLLGVAGIWNPFA